MVRKLFYVMAASIALISPAFAGNIECEDCNLYEHGVHRHIIPTNDLVCFWFVQPKPENVLLKLYLRDGSVRPYTKDARHAGTHGHICVGRSWVRQMTTQSFICNDVNHFDYGIPLMVTALAQKQRDSRDVEACLFGKDRCRKMGYPAYQ